MAISPISPVIKQKKGGGLFGKIAGGLAGAIGGAFLGQPVLGAQLGSQVGGAVGEAVKPTSASESKTVNALSSSLKTDPETQIAALAEGKRAVLQNQDLTPDEAQGLVGSYSEAQRRLRDRIGGFRGPGTGNTSTT